MGKMTSDYDWRLGLKVGDTLDCFDRGRWYCGTVLERIESLIDSKFQISYVFEIVIKP